VGYESCDFTEYLYEPYAPVFWQGI
jgi:hypothetical protein